MNKKLTVSLKKETLALILPLLIASCSEKNNNIDAELADVQNKLAQIDNKLDSMQSQTNVILLDSLSHDKRASELSGQIREHKKALAKLKAPKDTVKIKKFNRKINSLHMDSMMNATKVKEQIIAKRMNDFRKVYKEQDLLRAKLDSLMKIKSR